MTGANVARAMQLSPPTVHEMIGRLERDGYITRAGDKTISFTDTGAEHAEGVVRRHRLIERFLTDVLGHPLGRGPRGGRAAGARDVAGARGAHARRHRRRQDVPARPPDRRRHAHRGRAAGRRRAGRHGQGPAPGERGRGPPALPEGRGPRARASRPRCARTTATRSCSTPAAARCASCARSPRPSRWSPIRRRRRGSRCPSSSCSRATATGASAVVDLRGRVAIVTGGAAGAGASIVLRLADEGATVVVADVSDAAGEAAVAAITELGAGELRPHRRPRRRRRRAHGRLRRGAPRRRRHPGQQRRRLGADGELPVRLAAAVGLDARPQPARADARHPARARADAPARRRRRGQRRLDGRCRPRALRVARVRRRQGRPHPLHGVHGLRARGDRRARQLRRPGLDRDRTRDRASWPR